MVLKYFCFSKRYKNYAGDSIVDWTNVSEKLYHELMVTW